MKNKGLLGLLAIPLAGLGIVGSVAFAQTNTQPTTTPPVQTVQQVTANKEVPDAQEVGETADDQNGQLDQADNQNEVGDTDAQGSAIVSDGDGETNDDGGTVGK